MPTGVWLWGCTATASASASTVAWDGWECPRRSSLDATQPVGLAPAQVGGQLFFPGPSIVPERPDGRMKPGELQSGGYGFYYKGHQQAQPVQQRDVLQDLQAVITPMVSRPRSGEPARSYKELIASPVYFSNEKLAECLASHGLVVDAERRTLTVQSESVQAGIWVYDLTEKEVRTLVAAPIEEQPVEKRLGTAERHYRG